MIDFDNSDFSLPPGELTTLLQDWNGDRAEAGDRLFALVYPKLRGMAKRRLMHERRGHTHQPSDLVHEAYLRLAGQTRVRWRNREQFFAAVARAMRRILVDAARRGGRLKRGAGALRVAADDAPLPADKPRMDRVDLDRALGRLARINVTAARVVRLRFFGGLSLDDTAKVLGLGRATVVRAWQFAHAWLDRQLG